MSLINQVLKDLEKRHANADSGALARAVRPLPEERVRRGLWIGLGAIVIALAGGAGAWWWTMHGAKSFSPVLPPIAASQVPSAPPVPTVAATNTPSTLGKLDALPGTPAAPAVRPVPPPAADSAASHAATTPAPSPALSAAAKTGSSAPAVGGAHVDPKNAVKKPATTSTGSAAAPVSSPTSTTVAIAPTKKGEEAASASSMPPMIDSEAAPAAKPRASSAKTKPRPDVETAPKISAGAQNLEYPDAKSAPVDANIEKQVRPPSERERAEVSFRQGMTTLQNGNVAEAEVSLHEALRVDPLLDKARQALLGLYVEAGRRDEAERLLDERLKLDRKHFGFAMALARLQLERTSNGEALATLQRSLPYGENNAEYQAMLANALSRVARHKEAAERYDAAARLAPRNPLWQMGLGVELRADNRNAEARTAFQRARELGGLNAQLTSYLDQQLRELQ